MSDNKRKFQKAGAQGAYLKDFYESARKSLTVQLLDRQHELVYGDLGGSWNVFRPKQRRSYKLPEGPAQAVNNLDLVITHKSGESKQLFQNITVEVGGQVFDKISFYQTVHMNSLLVRSGRTVRRSVTEDGNEVTYIPLQMLPFYDHCLWPLCLLEHHDTVIRVDFGEVEILDAKIFGNKYYFDEKISELLPGIQTLTLPQTQYTGEEKEILDGVKPLKIRLNFNHPVTTLYFWGLELSKITSVSLTFDDQEYMSLPIHALQRVHVSLYPDTLKMFQPHSDVIVLHLSQQSLVSASPERSNLTQAINFSMINNALLVIKTAQKGEVSVNVCALGLQEIKLSSGMGALTYSK